MRIAAVYPSPYLDSTPCLFNLIQALAGRGHCLTVYTSRQGNLTAPTFCGDVRAQFHEGSRRSFPSWLKRTVGSAKCNYDVIVAMDRMGVLACAWAFGMSASLPWVYFNVELYRPPIFKGWKHRVANAVEAWVVRRNAKLVIAPSVGRGNFLAQWYELDKSRIITLPNSPRGSASVAPGDYLRRKYQIEEGRPILLYFGSLTSANRIEELLASVKTKWPESFVLVLHDRQRGDDSTQKWFESKVAGSRCRVIFSLDPLAQEELAEMVRSADAGIALYPTAGEGFETMGTASGKIAQYLHSGVPVITSDARSLKELFAHYPRAGAAVSHADAIPDAVTRLLSSGRASREAAAQCFDAEFSFDRAFTSLLPRLDSLARPGGS